MHGLYTGCKTPLSVAGGEGRPCACERVCNGANSYRSYLMVLVPGSRCAGSRAHQPGTAPGRVRRPAYRRAACLRWPAVTRSVAERATDPSAQTDRPRESASHRESQIHIPITAAERAPSPRGRQRSRRARAVAHTCPAVAATLLTMVDAGAVGPWAVPASAERRARGVVYGLLRYTTRSSEYYRIEFAAGGRCVSAFGVRARSGPQGLRAPMC